MTDQSTSYNTALMPPKIIYGLYAVGYFIGITSLAGIIYAYLSRGNNSVADTHLTFQIRTFWISLAIALAGFITAIIGVGFIIFIFLLVWGLARIISGFLLAIEEKPIQGTRFLGVVAY